MKIALLGDIALVGQFTVCQGWEKKISYLKEILEDYDYVVANLESPLTNVRRTLVPKSMHLKSDKENVKILKYLGIDAVTLANNHSLDYGRKGLDDTIATLINSGIDYYGVDGKSLYKEIKGEIISLSGFCCLSTNGAGYNLHNKKGINTLTRELLEKQLSEDKKRQALSIVSAHFGIEHTSYPAIEHISLFENVSLINNMILHGHHPHQIQGIIQKGNSLYAYSLGNALFDKTSSITGAFEVDMNEENRKSFVLGINIQNGKIVDYETIGFYISNRGVCPYEVGKELTEISSKLVNIENVDAYMEYRKSQYKSVLIQKFGKRDIKWLCSRLNYYSVGAKVLTVCREKKYQRIKRNF